MLYTIAQISKKIGLSKVSIYKKLRLKEMQIHISKKRGITYVDEEGFKHIKDIVKAYTESSKGSKNEANSIPLNDGIATDIDDLNLKNDYILTLKDQLKVKDLQLSEQMIAKDIQINNLNERLKQALELNKNSQILQLKQQPQDIKQLEEHFSILDDKLEEVKNKMSDRKEQQEHKSFFSKMFKSND